MQAYAVFYSGAKKGEQKDSSGHDSVTTVRKKAMRTELLGNQRKTGKSNDGC